LKYEFLEPLGMPQVQLAAAIGITRVRINKIVPGKRPIGKSGVTLSPKSSLGRNGSGLLEKAS